MSLMLQPYQEQKPREPLAREIVRASHIIVAVITAMLSLIPLGIWKGTVDDRLDNDRKMLDEQREQLQHMNDKLDRIMEMQAEKPR